MTPESAAPENANRPPVLVLVRDLFFVGKITAVAASVGALVQVIRDPARLAGSDGRMLILDLNLAGAVEAAAAWAKQTGGRTIGFVAHVDSAAIERARAAGVHKVLPRSQFVEKLPELLA